MVAALGVDGEWVLLGDQPPVDSAIHNHGASVVQERAPDFVDDDEHIAVSLDDDSMEVLRALAFLGEQTLDEVAAEVLREALEARSTAAPVQQALAALYARREEP